MRWNVNCQSSWAAAFWNKNVTLYLFLHLILCLSISGKLLALRVSGVPECRNKWNKTKGLGVCLICVSFQRSSLCVTLQQFHLGSDTALLSSKNPLKSGLFKPVTNTLFQTAKAGPSHMWVIPQMTHPSRASLSLATHCVLRSRCYSPE